jgi:uncharacterized membrane protein YczE
MRILKTFIGSLVVAVGVIILLEANMGADPLSVFLLGIINQSGEFLGIRTFGTLSTGFGLFILLVILMADRNKVGIGSIINCLSVGIFINFLYSLSLDQLIPDFPFLNLILGPVVIGIGLTIYLSADLGAGFIEAIMLIVVERTGFSLKYVRIFLDGLFVAVGLLLGAPFGWGILSGVLLIGPTIEYSMKFIQAK